MLCSSNSIAGTWMTNPIRISPTRRRNGQAGFTMMELLIGIAVLAILTTLAVPAFTQFIANNRLAAKANEMVASFQFARSEAIKRGKQVQVCDSADGSTCGGGWNQGWITMADPAGTPEVLRVWQSPGTDFAFAPANGTVIFERTGFVSGAAQQFDLQLTGSTDGNDRRVLIERTGRVVSCRIDEPPCLN
mgnify:CR=1 FL=1